MIKRLRLKFVCINMAIVTLMLCVMFGMTLNMTNDHLEQEGLRMLREMHMPEKEKKGEKPEENTDKRPMDKKEEHPDDKHGARLPTFTLRYEPSGALWVSGSDTFDLTDTAYLQSVLDAAIATGAASGELEAHSLRFLRLNDVQGGYIFADISSERTTMQNLLRDCMIIGIIAFVSFLGISIFLSFWAIKPVERAWTQQRQFVGDASHELKTPLTVIMTNAEMLREAPSEEKREQCAENIHRMSLQMRSLIEELLTLARAEDVQRVNMQSVELSEILDDAVLQFEPLFYERGLTLQTEIAENLRVHGDATLLGRLVEVLLDNAQKYSLPGEVCLSLKKHGCHAELRICNPAEAISEEDLAHLFERFYRVDKARSSTGSYGLGLSIADGITRRHGGSIRAEYADGRLAFHVKLPIR